MGLSHSPRIVTDGLVFCVDAANKRSYPGAGTAWTDLTANKNNVTLVNGVTFDSNNAGGIAFDGTNDRVTINDFEDLNLHDASFSCGVKVDALGADRDLFVKGAHAFGAGIICWYDVVAGGGQQVGNTNCISVSTNDNSLELFISGPNSSVSAGEILVVDVTIDASAGKISLYKNAELLVSHTDSNYDGMGNTDANYHLGADSSYNKDLVGNIYFFRAYNKCLSAAEITQNYNATRGRFQ